MSRCSGRRGSTPLTGVYNYRFFVEKLDEQFRLYGRECLTLLYIDVDDFKLYNQLYGVGEGRRGAVPHR